MDDGLVGVFWFGLAVCFFGLVGFCVRTCAAMPDPSVECAKLGGKWTGESITANGYKINGFCSK